MYIYFKFTFTAACHLGCLLALLRIKYQDSSDTHHQGDGSPVCYPPFPGKHQAHPKLAP